MITKLNFTDRTIKSYAIRKLTPKECFRLMGVRDNVIGTLYRIYSTTDRPFLQLVDVDGETFLRIRQATEQGYTDCPCPGAADLSYPSSALRRSRTVGGKLVNALTAASGGICLFVEL